MFKTVSNQQNRVFVFIPFIKKYTKFFLNNQNPFLSLLGNLCTVPKYLTDLFLMETELKFLFYKLYSPVFQRKKCQKNVSFHETRQT